MTGEAFAGFAKRLRTQPSKGIGNLDLCEVLRDKDQEQKLESCAFRWQPV